MAQTLPYSVVQITIIYTEDQKYFLSIISVKFTIECRRTRNEQCKNNK